MALAHITAHISVRFGPNRFKFDMNMRNSLSMKMFISNLQHPCIEEQQRYFGQNMPHR